MSTSDVVSTARYAPATGEDCGTAEVSVMPMTATRAALRLRGAKNRFMVDPPSMLFGTPVVRLGCGHGCARVDENFPEQRAMAPRFVLAVASNREIGFRRERSEQSYEPPGLWPLHLLPIALCVPRPALFRKRLRQRPRDERRARSKIGKPEVEIVLFRVALLTDSPRRASHRAKPKSFIAKPRASESNNTYGHDDFADS